jgi:hypothetical protein
MRRDLKSYCRFCMLIAFMMLVGGCASTSIRSQADTAALRPYPRIMAFVSLADLGLRQDAETVFERELAQCNIECVPSHKLFFPSRQYSDEEAVQLISESSIDAVLIVTLSDTGTSSSYVPQQTYTQAKAQITGNTATGSSTTTTSGGYSIEKPWANFTAQLFDCQTGNVVWVASASTGGNAYASGGTLVRSMADKTVDQLKKDGIVPTPSGRRYVHGQQAD